MSKALRTADGKLECVLGLEWRAGEVADLPLRLRFAEVDGRWICACVEIGADFNSVDAPDPKRVTTSALRSVNLATLIENELLRFARQVQGRVEELGGDSEVPLTAGLARKAAGGAKKRPGRPRQYAESHYDEVADVYNSFGGRARTKAVAEHFHVSKEAAAKWVAHCRGLGKIPPWGEEADG